jgi:ketosteroid isomerase-like protein
MKARLFTIFGALVLISFSSFAAAAQQNSALTPAEVEVRKLERAWLDAYEKKDVAAMTAIVADDFTITFSDGSIQTKPQIIESLKRPGGTTSKFTTENVQSRVYGDTVILIGIVISEWKQNGEPMSDRSRYTDTYVKRNGKWQVVASHLSKVGK